MTAAAPGRQASRAAGGNAAGGPATLVLSCPATYTGPR